MSIFITIIFLVTILRSSVAQIQFDDEGVVIPSQGSQYQPLCDRLQQELKLAATNHVAVGGPDQYKAKFSMSSQGIICQLTVRLDNPQGKDAIKPLSTTVVNSDGSITPSNIVWQKGFHYKEVPLEEQESVKENVKRLGGVTCKTALEEGKTYVNESLVAALKHLIATNKYFHVGFSTHLTSGTEDGGLSSGVYLYFAVYFSNATK